MSTPQHSHPGSGVAVQARHGMLGQERQAMATRLQGLAAAKSANAQAGPAPGGSLAQEVMAKVLLCRRPCVSRSMSRHACPCRTMPGGWQHLGCAGRPVLVQ